MRAIYGGGVASRAGLAYALPRPLLLYDENVDDSPVLANVAESLHFLASGLCGETTDDADDMVSREVEEPDDELIEASSNGGSISERDVEVDPEVEELEEPEAGKCSLSEAGDFDLPEELSSSSDTGVTFPFPLVATLDSIW